MNGLSTLSAKQLKSIQDDPIAFGEIVLGLPLYQHKGQVKWVKNSTKLVNILKPGNQWGKTLITSVKHIHHAVTKPGLRAKAKNLETWRKVRYETANVGKTYEIARGVFETVQDVVNSNFLIGDTGKTNVSLLADWAITRIDDMPKPPAIKWWNGSATLIRSYDDLGSSFKRKKLAYVSSDECGDLPELKLFLWGTLVPRVTFFQGKIDLIGTSQPAGVEYEELYQEAKKEFDENAKESSYYVQEGTMFENPFNDQAHIRNIEKAGDPTLIKQIIYGQYVDYKDKYFTWAEVQQLFTDEMDWDPATGVSEPPDPNGKYLFSNDLAASNDKTVLFGIRYDVKPYRLVFAKFFKGKEMPLSMQYVQLKAWYLSYKRVAPNCKYIFDFNSLGGKASEENFEDIHAWKFPPKGMSYSLAKSNAVRTLKTVLQRGREVKEEEGKIVDLKPGWGGLRMSSKLVAVKKEMEGYTLNDKNIVQDLVATLYMGIFYIEMLHPTLSHAKAVPFNLAASNLSARPGGVTRDPYNMRNDKYAQEEIKFKNRAVSV